MSGWDSVRKAMEMVEGRVEFVVVELAQDWSWKGWMQNKYGGWEFGLCGENGVWRAVRMVCGDAE